LPQPRQAAVTCDSVGKAPEVHGLTASLMG
jgi:hypothetical protein